MNDFTLMIIFSAVLLAVVVAVHLWAQVKRVGIYAPEQEEAGLTIDSVVDATFIINRHAIKCISETFVCKDGYTWLALRDELMFSVIYEDADICHCKVVPGFEWLALDYIHEGVIPMSMVEVANA